MRLVLTWGLVIGVTLAAVAGLTALRHHGKAVARATAGLIAPAYEHARATGFGVENHPLVDWRREGWRLVGDVAGCVFSPVGAIANVTFNLVWDQSQIGGGVSELFRDADIHDPFRYAAKLACRWFRGRSGESL